MPASLTNVRQRVRTVVTLVGAAIGVCVGSMVASAQQPTTASLSADQIETLGDDLHAAIDREFASLRTTHIPLPGERRWAPLGMGSDVSGFVKRYVPLGLPIGQAESILERAGLPMLYRGRRGLQAVPGLPPIAYRTDAGKQDLVNGMPRHIVVQLDPQYQSDDAPVVVLKAYMRKDDSPPRP